MRIKNFRDFMVGFFAGVGATLIALGLEGMMESMPMSGYPISFQMPLWSYFFWGGFAIVLSLLVLATVKKRGYWTD